MYSIYFTDLNFPSGPQIKCQKFFGVCSTLQQRKVEMKHPHQRSKDLISLLNFNVRDIMEKIV